MPTHALELTEGLSVPVPGTRLSLKVEAIRHRIAAADGDEFPRSMMTAHFTLWEGERQVAEARGIDGQRVRLGAVELRFHGQGAEPSSVKVDVTPR